MVEADRYRARVEEWVRVLRPTGLREGAPLLLVDPTIVDGLGAAEWMVDRVVGDVALRGGRLRVDDGPVVPFVVAPDSAPDARTVALPARTAAAAQASSLVVVARARALVPGLPVVGVARDHVNLSGDNPLVGPNRAEWGVRFPDMSDPYTQSLRDAVPDVAGWVFAELAFPMDPGDEALAGRLGADVCGRGIAPLAIVSAHSGLPFAALLTLDDGPGASPALARAARRLLGVR